ncbi:hypothetical protein EG329_003307 [Mollisiaceae sp. DMI_Dod_QoI]|nr:hypothetical protein EG329_003307 [Helotiales sp. DMI_Dod_QoI]
MSFGWSAGDIVSAINLVNRVLKSVSNVSGARDDFQELQSELRALSRALQEISDLAKLPGQHPDITTLKFAACLCEETLSRFLDKIKPFDDSLGLGSKSSRLKAVPRMVRWELLVKKDIPEFRSYLVAHVGALNMRISTISLKFIATASARSDQHYAQNRFSAERMREDLQNHTQAICAKITSMSQTDTIPKLTSLLDVATNVWKAQNELIDLCSKTLNTAPRPNTRYTWAQAPVRFEDALGRVIPVPSEYGWDTLEAVIQARFKNDPGQEKVLSGEYELYSGGKPIGPLQDSRLSLMPGMMITMTFIIGQYAGSERCPRLGCDSRSFSGDATRSKPRECAICRTTFRQAQSPLPRPMKPTALPQQSSSTRNVNGPNNKAKDDRRYFRNISLFITELPATPTRFRGKHYRSSSQQKKQLDHGGKNSNQRSDRAPSGTSKMSTAPRGLLQECREITYSPYTEVFNRFSTVGLPYQPETTVAHLTTFHPTKAVGPPASFQSVPPLNYSGIEELDQRAPTSLKMLERLFGSQFDSKDIDQDFKEELLGIVNWFNVLNEAEQTAAMYMFLQQANSFQISFFRVLLRRMSAYEWRSRY